MALKLQEEYGDDLLVLFVEVQGASPEKAEAFALDRKWLGGKAMWTTERPFDVGLRGIPQFGLLAPTGELVLSGYSNRMKGDIEDAIEEMVKAKRKAPKDLPKDVGKSWVALGKGELGKALELARTAVEEAEDDAERKAAEDMVARVEARIQSSLESVEWMMENGYVLQAEVQTAALSKVLADHEEAAAFLAECRAKLDSDAMKRELAAAKELAKIEKKLYQKGPEEKFVKSLNRLAEKHPGTKTAERAQHLAKLAAMG